MINIDIINLSSLHDSEITPVVNAIQRQVTEHFAPSGYSDAKLTQICKGDQADPYHRWVCLFDRSDQPGALGYHELNPAGQPLGKIFILDDKDFGLEWSITLSHEILEMLCDPDCITTKRVWMSDGTVRSYMEEPCDACEDDSFGYQIDGVWVSDFVLSAFWGGQIGQFDFCEHIIAPLQILDGGYLAWYDKDGNYATETLGTAQGRALPTQGNRRSEKRQLPKSEWKRSVLAR